MTVIDGTTVIQEGVILLLLNELFPEKLLT